MEQSPKKSHHFSKVAIYRPSNWRLYATSYFNHPLIARTHVTPTKCTKFTLHYKEVAKILVFVQRTRVWFQLSKPSSVSLCLWENISRKHTTIPIFHQGSISTHIRSTCAHKIICLIGPKFPNRKRFTGLWYLQAIVWQMYLWWWCSSVKEFGYIWNLCMHRKSLRLILLLCANHRHKA